MVWAIVADDLSGDEIRDLLRLHFEGMLANSPPGSCHFLDFEGLQSDDVTFWSIWDDTALAGCGALRELDPSHGEIKSMRTAAEHLGRGVGSAMLEHLLNEARSRGYARVSLETGSGPPFAAAHRLYERFGFTSCEPFGSYQHDPFSRFMTRAL